MADFCKQCAITIFGDDPAFNDAVGLITKEQTLKGIVLSFLCEGCGPIIIDHEGNCLSKCLEHHDILRVDGPCSIVG